MANLLHARLASGKAVDQTAWQGQLVQHFKRRPQRMALIEHGIEEVQHLGKTPTARREAQPVHTSGPKLWRLGNQAMQISRLGTDAVQGKEGLTFAAAQQQTIRVLTASKITLILAESMVARREAAR